MLILQNHKLLKIFDVWLSADNSITFSYKFLKNKELEINWTVKEIVT